jgi:pantoate kinase
VEAAAIGGLALLGSRPTPRSFLAASESFTDGLGLASPGVRRRLDRLRRTGASAAQAMFGRAIFAVAHDSAERSRLVRTLASERLSAVEMAVLPPTSETL